MQKHLLYMHNTHVSGITKKEYINLSHSRNIDMFIYEQGAQNRKKVYLVNADNTALRFYRSLVGSGTTSLLFIQQKQKEVEEEFLELSCDISQGP